MRYVWILLAYLTSIVVAVASCSSGMGTGATGHTTDSSGRGGSGTGPSGSGGGGSLGFGGSMGSFMFDAGSDAPCASFKSCQDQGFNCGMATDGCSNPIDCGSCSGNEVCTANVCGLSMCMPKTCMDQGFDCGMAGDTCNGIILCGPTCPSGQTCGGGGPNVCGNGMCKPKTCMDQGFVCGNQGDTCGGMLSCGTCPTNFTCGASGMTGKCVQTCFPKTTCPAGDTCGAISDGCAGVLMCGTCGAGQTCSANKCITGMGGCTGPLVQVMCPNNGTTTVTGTVYAPNGSDPLYNVLVYVPNGGPAPTYGVQAFPPNITCDNCGAAASGCPLVQAVTGVDGKFTLTNVPPGTSIPLVMQLGRWRRQIVIPTVTQCVSTAVAATLTHMPTTHVQGDIPLMGFVTGEVDALECVLRKIGIADSEFSDPSGTGRVRFYQGAGAPGATYSREHPVQTQLWGTQAEIDKYDMVYFACQGSEFDQAPMDQQTVINYANAGGRVFATHFSYVWLDNTGATNDGWNVTAHWAPDPNVSNAFANDPQTGYINTSFPKGQILAQWLQIVGASSTYGQMPIGTLRDDFTGVIAPSQLWINVVDQSLGNVPMHYTFNTPVGAAPAAQCGRVLYDDFHVEDALTIGATFPDECACSPDGGNCETNAGCCSNNCDLDVNSFTYLSCLSPMGGCHESGTNCTANASCCSGVCTGGKCAIAMSPQEKMLEFMLFDLASCVTPDVPTCTPLTCAQQNIQCGPAGDGCSGVIQCGMCPSGQTCGGGGMANKCGNSCTPQTCMQQGFTCGMQGDTCGNIINCGSCPSGICGGGGNPGHCGNGNCVPKTCANLNATCGNEGDGCGNILNCGACPSGQTCGGGGTAGKCGSPPCTPKTCAGLGYNCGSAADGCGNLLNCGTCTAPELCGGGGVANKCGGTGPQ